MKEDQTISIPIPDRSGSTGGQLPADSSQVFYEANPLQGLHLASTISGLASSNTRSFGGDVSAALIAATARQIGAECSELKLKNCQLDGRIESLRDELEAERIKSAVLTEKIRSEGRNKHLRNLGITVGTSLLGVGIVLARAGQDNYSYGATIFGVLLVVLAWFSGPKEQKS